MTRPYAIPGPWSGKLAIAARPRGGDWLPDEIAAWQKDGFRIVLSLLTPDEEEDLDLSRDSVEVRRHNLNFITFPVADRQVPRSEAELNVLLEKVDAELSSGRSVLVHCRQGIGRSGLLAACLLIGKGLSSGAAMEAVSVARGVLVPETPEQHRWVERYAATLARAN